MKRNEYVNVDILISNFPKVIRDGLAILNYLVGMILFAVTFIYGIQFAGLGKVQMSPTLGIPMMVAYSSMAIAAFFVIIYGAINLVDHMRNMGKGGSPR
jgi:TRAP-type C4-dicarboxylate transport system permease small subunit